MKKRFLNLIGVACLALHIILIVVGIMLVFGGLILTCHFLQVAREGQDLFFLLCAVTGAFTTFLALFMAYFIEETTGFFEKAVQWTEKMLQK